MPRALKVMAAGEPYVLSEDEPVPAHGDTQVLIKVEACGLCGGDEVARRGLMSGLRYPLQAGHEIVGTVHAVGVSVRDRDKWHLGQRVGVGWHAGHCFTCKSCARGDFNGCPLANATGATTLGGLGEYCVAEESALVAIPDGVDSMTAAPLLCAGLTAYNALRRSRAKLGDSVAIVGLGGIGMYAVMFVRAAGMRVSVFSSSDAKREAALELGAHAYYQLSKAGDVVPADLEEIHDSGGLDVVLATAPDGRSMATLVPALKMDGEVLLIGEPPTPLQVEVIPLLLNRGSLIGWTAGTNAENEQCLRTAQLLGITEKSNKWLQTIALDEVEESYSKGLREVKFRYVVDPRVERNF